MEILFSTPDILARRVGARRGPALVITFTSFEKPAELKRKGFGEDFLAKEGIPALHVSSRGNRWFQYQELPALIMCLKAAANAYDRVITYGSSMGGFAALAYGADCGAQLGLAISPQASLNAREVPFETRWRREAARIRRWHAPLARLPEQIIAFDPRHTLDAKHHAILAARTQTHSLRMPYAGHPAGSWLVEAGLLKSLVYDALDGTFDASSYEARLKESRRGSSQYLYSISRRLGSHHEHKKLRIMQMAMNVSQDPHILVETGACLSKIGEYSAAENMYSMASKTGNVDAIMEHGKFLFRHSRYRECAALMNRVIETYPEARTAKLLIFRSRIANLLHFLNRFLK